VLPTIIIIPTYNNQGSIAEVVSSVQKYCGDVIVINDGSTDDTADILNSIPSIEVISYSPNRGKGYALRKGFETARSKGYEYAITIDADGQHPASYIPSFLEESAKHPHSIIVGSRVMEQKNKPAANSFANRFSNFWFRLQTGVNLPDTQSGYRLYPLSGLPNNISNRYEAELELLVRASWQGFQLRHIPIEAYYPPEGERVTHFRPFRDFMRITVFNTAATVLSVGYRLLGRRQK
jgi:glycosyltransferase involved in cell wall biosynthesis